MPNDGTMVSSVNSKRVAIIGPRKPHKIADDRRSVWRKAALGQTRINEE